MTIAKLRAWVKKYLRPQPGHKMQSTDSLPFLSSSRCSLPLASSDTQPCLFFQLPYDVRSIILLMVFGGRHLHVGMTRREEGWQWRGVVCRNLRPGPPTRWYGRVGMLWTDTCVEQSQHGRWGCIVGILGFLLSCRQAYHEGIDVLYSANCILIQSEPVLLHLPQLIAPNRLASITSLGVVIAAHRVEHENGRPTFRLDHLKPILDNIAAHCNHLRFFWLPLMVASHFHEEIEDAALPSMDAFHRSVRLRSVRVELPSQSTGVWAPTQPWTIRAKGRAVLGVADLYGGPWMTRSLGCRTETSSDFRTRR